MTSSKTAMKQAIVFDSPYLPWIGAVVLGVGFLYYYFTRTDIPFIKGIPEIPGALPMYTPGHNKADISFGHLLQLGEDHATVCQKWAGQYKWPVFQMRLGNMRAVVINTFDTSREMLVDHTNQCIDRPTLYTFHGLISSTQGFTIGSSPYDESCKKRRKAAATALAKPAMKKYLPMFDLETWCVIRDYRSKALSSDVKNLEFNPRPFLQRFALNTTLTLCYGIRMDDAYDELLREILCLRLLSLDVGSAISLLRSASENYQDYIPIMRYFPDNEKNKRGVELRERRDKYLNHLLDEVKKMIEAGTDKPCIASAIIKGDNERLNDVEVGSICLSLVSGGFETIPGTLTSVIGSLSTKEGQEIQKEAYDAILDAYNGDKEAAWADAITDEKVEYVNAIVKEGVRYYTVSSMSLPRKAIEDFHYHGSLIPKGTMILINAQAANHDPTHYGPDAHIFNPRRWLNMPPSKVSSTLHFGFGAGSRMCAGHLIATRLCYALLVRFILSFEVIASETNPPNTDYVEYNSIKTALVAIPRDFGVRLRLRDEDWLEKKMKEEEPKFYS